MNFSQGLWILIFSFVSRVLSFETELFTWSILNPDLFMKIILGVNTPILLWQSPNCRGSKPVILRRLFTSQTHLTSGPSPTDPYKNTSYNEVLFHRAVLRIVVSSWSLKGEKKKDLMAMYGITSFHSNPKERQCQRMLKLPHNCTHLTH